jgi:molecular chaperone GrpE
MPTSGRHRDSAAKTPSTEERVPATAEADEIEELRTELRRKDDLYLRALADFDNYRKRIERDQANSIRSGKREVLLALLETMDSFDRALEHMAEDPERVLAGLQAIHRRLLAQLEAQGVKPFNSRGELFDPRLHEAVASVDTEGLESGRIAEETQRGYRWGDELLRPARVKVAR